jgi:hypothetical protein
MPNGKDWMWLVIGIAVGWFVVPMILARKGTKPATTAGY